MADRNVDYQPIIYFIACIAAISGFLFGYDTGVISGAILFIRKELVLGTFMTEIVVSSVLIGCVFGAIFAGKMADFFGRRHMLILAAIIFTIGSLGTAFAPNVETLILGRIVVGLAIGASSFIAPLYISEMSPMGIRGALVALNQFAITLGIVVSYLVDYAFAFSEGWRWMFGIAAVPSVFLGISLFFLPDSPRWLMKVEEKKRARGILEKIRGTKEVDEEYNGIDESLSMEKGNWRELFTYQAFPPLVIGVILAFMQQATGINTVIYYAPTIFQMAGFESNATAIFATFGVGMVNMLTTVFALWLIDRAGRRPLLLYGIAGMIIALTILGFAFFFGGNGMDLGTVAVVSLMIYVAGFAIGLGPVFWVLIAEIYPLRTRGLAMSIATFANWGSNLLIAVTFLSLIQGAGKPGTFWLYGFISLLAWLFVYFFIPETKGRSLEWITKQWHSGKRLKELRDESRKTQ